MSKKGSHRTKKNHTTIVERTDRTENTPGKTVDILKHISNISTVSGPQYKTKFVSQSHKTRTDHIKLSNGTIMKNPRNMKLIESDSEEEDMESFKNRTTKNFFDENAVLAGIRSMAGGREYSDRYIEKRWTERQEQSQNLSTIIASNEDKPVNTKSNHNSDVFARNVLMKAVMKSKMEKNVGSTETEEAAAHSETNCNEAAESVCKNSCTIPFVEDPIDSDFMFRKFVDSNDKDDYIVEHIGKVTSVTARDYLIENIDDAGFAFPKNNK